MTADASSGGPEAAPVMVCPRCQAKWQQQPLTKRQAEVLTYLRGYIDTRGIAPTFEEIGAHFGFASMSTVADHLRSLEVKGYIIRQYNETRSIQIVGAPDAR